jgi:hypothetical protein
MAVTFPVGMHFEDAVTGEYTIGDGDLNNGATAVAEVLVNGGSSLPIAASDPDEEPNLHIGINDGGDGLLTITGQGSTVTLTGNGSDERGMSGRVGANGGIGEISIAAGGTFLMTDPTGDLIIDEGNGIFTDEFFVFGRNGGQGTLNVHGDDGFGVFSSFTIEGSSATAQFGRDGGTGAAAFSGGADFMLKDLAGGANGSVSLQVGRGVGATGTFDLDGAGTTAILDASLGGFSSLQLGRDRGQGTMNVTDGATVELKGGSNGVGLQIGRNGGEGKLVIDGAASDVLLDGSGGSFSGLNIASDGGGGEVNVAGGASLRVQSAGNGDDDDGAYIELADGFGSDGSVVVGAGSELLLQGSAGATSFAAIGLGGTALLDISDGGLVHLTSDKFSGMDVGNGGFARVMINNTGNLLIEGTGDGANANMVIGRDFGDGYVFVDGSTITLKAQNFANIQVGTAFDHDDNDAGSGLLYLENGAEVLFDVGNGSRMDIGGGEGSEGVVAVIDGSVLNLDIDDTAKGAIKIGAHGPGTGALYINGMGSTVRGLNYLQVGFNPADGNSQAGGTGTLVMGRGALLIADFVSVGTGGTVEAGDATIQGNAELTTGGTFDMADGLIRTFNLNGDFNSVGNGNRVFLDVGGGGNDVINIDGDININNGAVNITLDAINGFDFSQGNTRTLINIGGGIAGTRMELAVTGQHADFGYAAGIIDDTTQFEIEALNSGTTGGVAVLDFGTVNGPANLTYNTNTGSGTAFGGRFTLPGVRVYNVDSFIGTDEGDTFVISGTTKRALTINAGDGNDSITGGRGKDTMTGGLGDNDTFIFANKLDSGKTLATADVIKDFDDGTDGDKINISALQGPVLAFIATAAFTKPGQVRVNDVAGPHVLIEVNLTGNTGAEFAILLENTTKAMIAKGDFIL